MITSIDRQKCTGCGSCVRKCTLDVFSLDTNQEDLAPCMAGCPCRADIRGVLYLLQQDKQEEALQLLKQSVPFPALTSRLCAHACEDSCIRQPEAERVDVCGLERFLGDLDLRTPPPAIRERHVARVAVIGGGLTGMSCAYFLRVQGYPVALFDEDGSAGGWLKYLEQLGMPHGMLEYCEGTLRKMGVEFCLPVKVGHGGDVSLGDLFREGFRAVCIATGSEEGFRQAFPEAVLDDGRILADAGTCQTKACGVFAAGGCCGASAPETATAQAHDAALSVNAYLSGIDMMVQRPVRSMAKVLPPVLPTFAPGISSRVDDWTSVMALEAMQRESFRCCTCGSKAFIAHPDDCMTCFTCEMSCPAGAVTVHPFKEILPRSLKESWERRS